MRKIYSKIIKNIIFFIFGIWGLVGGIKSLNQENLAKIPMNDEIIIYYLKLVFFIVALPVFLIMKFFEFAGYLPKENIGYYHIEVFYNSVYFIMVVYGLLIFIDKILN